MCEVTKASQSSLPDQSDTGPDVANPSGNLRAVTMLKEMELSNTHGCAESAGCA